MPAAEPVAQLLFGAWPRDRRAVQQQADHLPALGVGALGQCLALARHLLGDGGDRVVDERRDRAAGDVEQLAQLLGVGGEGAGDLRPEAQRDALPDPVRVQRRLVQPAPDQVAGDRQRLVAHVGRHPPTGGADIGGGPEQQVGPVGAAGRRREHRVVRQLLPVHPGQRRPVQLRQPVGRRVQRQLRPAPDQLTYLRRRQLPVHGPSLRPVVCSASLRGLIGALCAGSAARRRPGWRLFGTGVRFGSRPYASDCPSAVLGRRPDRGCRDLRHRCRVLPAARAPAAQLRRPGGARGLRRHLGPVPLPGHPLGLGPAHLRLRVQAVARRALDRRRRPDPRLCARGGGRARHRPEDPLQHEGAERVLVLVRRALERGGRVRRDRRAHDAQLQLDLLRRRLLPLRRGLHPALRGPGGVPRAGGAPAALAAGPGQHRQAGAGDRQRGHRGHPGPGPGRDRRTRHHAAAHPELRDAGAREGPARQPAAQPARRGARVRGRAPQEHPPAAGGLAVLPEVPEGGPAADPALQPEAAARRLPRRRALQPALRPLGPAAVRRAQRRPVPRHPRGPGVGGHRPHREVHRDRRAAGVGPHPGGGPHRHRHRPERTGHGRDRADRRRRAGPAGRHGRLQGDDALRGAELRLRDRLHQLLLDPEGRPALRALLPTADPDGRPGRRHRAPGAHRSGHADPAVPRLRRRVHSTRDRPAPAPGRPRAVADLAELQRRRQAPAPPAR